MSLHKRGQGSLRLHLMIWLAAPVVVILAVSIWLSYGSALRQATLVMERNLMASARIIAEQIHFSDGSIGVVIPPSALELFASDSHDEVAYAVIGPRNNLIAGFPGLAAPTKPPAEFGFRSFETMFRTEAMRAIIFQQPVVTPGQTVTVSVIVGETQKARDELFRSLWLRGFMEQAALVLAAAASIWIGINRELRPLLHLRQAVLERPVDRFEPFKAESVQSEIQPLVLALNRHMERLKQQLERQKRFLDHAAHQLRTPLAILKTQIGFARRTRGAAERGSALVAVDENLTTMSRLTNQLLTLGRVDHGGVLQNERVELNEVVRHAVADAAPRALDKGVDLVFETDGACAVVGSAALLREIAVNLIDNAIEYAGTGAVASVYVRGDGQSVVLTVEDDGLGVDEDERSTLLEPFRRGQNAPAGGSGLGLSIVAEIAKMFKGSVELAAPATGKGFRVVVRLQAARSGLPLPSHRIGGA